MGSKRIQHVVALTTRLIVACLLIAPATANDAKPDVFERRTLTIETSDGVSLAATYFAPAQAGPAVLLIHMCRGDADRTTWTKTAAQLATSGMHVLTFDLRGYGESGGGEPDFTTMANFIEFWRTTGMNDIDAAYRFLTAQPGVNARAIGIGGASCGVFLGIEAGKRYGDVKALALLSGPFDAGAQETLSELDAIPVFGAASEDDTLAYEAMKRVFLTTDHPGSRNHQFKGDAHGTDMFAQQEYLEGEIVAWFQRWLLE